MRRQRNAGLTLVEMLIVMAILGIVLLVTSGGIIQALQVNRVAEDATNTQSKLRRVTEVITQELRTAVLGGITDYPVLSSSDSISFALLTGDGGIAVTEDPGGSAASSVYASDPSALADMVGHPAVMINNDGQAMIIPRVSGYSGNSRVFHDSCAVSIPYDTNTRLYRAASLGFWHDPGNRILYQTTFHDGAESTVPFAFDLEVFRIEYEYASASGIDLRNEPFIGSNGEPQPTYVSGGDEYELARLRLTLASSSDGDRAPREYVSYIELTGLGNEIRPVTSMHNCDAWVPPVVPDPEPDPDPDPPTPDPGDPTPPTPTPDPTPDPPRGPGCGKRGC